MSEDYTEKYIKDKIQKIKDNLNWLLSMQKNKRFKNSQAIKDQIKEKQEEIKELESYL